MADAWLLIMRDSNAAFDLYASYPKRQTCQAVFTDHGLAKDFAARKNTSLLPMTAADADQYLRKLLPDTPVSIDPTDPYKVTTMPAREAAEQVSRIIRDE